MFNFNVRKLTATAAVFGFALIAGVTQPLSAQAGSYQICAGSQSTGFCLNSSDRGFGYLTQNDTTVQQVQYAAPLRSGTYFGTWKDGTNMVERIVVGNGTLTMQRLAGGHGSGTAGPAVTFFQTGTNEYTNQNGSKIFIASPTSFNWRNKHNGNHVFYQILN